ncbi:hypothetical protein [Desulfosudis oleivorans]|uniref:Uncharacterized protein n=1 Tax=Desulfosudis oleivorans (strain DSM 6200 / JCM 39069 / Hxd3) TaxID=96561 RepID=A8ZT39_DESOH|nr:hypothetical protein [Desulfosudis oleivorans]ABW66203.1 conserved hypothetical protein [Desulfosudis oleivorans Hxd3]
MLFKSKPIVSALVPVEKISEDLIREMHSLFIEYYENADYDTFKQDLGAKTGSFLWRERKTGRLIAFANIRLMKLPYKKRHVHVFFCGDTVCHRDYWQRNASGNSPMAATVYGFLLRFMMKHPFSTYWFMISMSFRTYLVIANNMVHHYPHYERTDAKVQKLKEICHLVAGHMYGDKFDPETGRVDFGRKDENQTIKSDVAPVTPEMLEKYPKIRFYESLNPDNQKGVELACIGAIDIDSITAYCKKFLRRTWDGLTARGKVTTLPSTAALDRNQEKKKKAA